MQGTGGLPLCQIVCLLYTLCSPRPLCSICYCSAAFHFLSELSALPRQLLLLFPLWLASCSSFSVLCSTVGTSQGPGVLSLCKSTTPGASMPFLQITPGPPPPLPWSLFPYFLECGWHLHYIFNPFESLHFFPLRHRPGKKSPSLDLIICSSVAELSSQSPRVKVLELLHLQCQPCKAYSLNLILSLVLTRPCLAQSNCFSSSFLMFPVSKWPTCCCHLDLSLTVPSSSRTLLIT